MIRINFALILFPLISSASGKITIDGSSTVFPILEAYAEEFGLKNKDVQVTVASSGTGGGFKKFCRGESDVSNASRPIKDTEIKLCAENKIEYIEVPIAFDALSVVVSQKNKFIDCLKVEDLKKLWEPDSKISNWNDLNSSFPKQPVKLFGPGSDSGTFDYFTEAVNGKEDACRKDFVASEDDNVIAKGVMGSEHSLGYFGFAYYENNKSKLKAVKIDSGKGCVAPSRATVLDGTYKPLSRPLFVYVSKKSLARKEVQDFFKFIFEDKGALSESVGYFALSTPLLKVVREHFDKKVTGSMYKSSHDAIKVPLESLYKVSR